MRPRAHVCHGGGTRGVRGVSLEEGRKPKGIPRHKKHVWAYVCTIRGDSLRGSGIKSTRNLPVGVNEAELEGPGRLEGGCVAKRDQPVVPMHRVQTLFAHRGYL